MYHSAKGNGSGCGDWLKRPRENFRSNNSNLLQKYMTVITLMQWKAQYKEAHDKANYSIWNVN